MAGNAKAGGLRIRAESSQSKDISAYRSVVVRTLSGVMVLQRSEENSDWKGRGGRPGLGMNIRYFVIFRGRKMGGSEGILSAVTWCLFLLLMGVETVEANRSHKVCAGWEYWE